MSHGYFNFNSVDNEKRYLRMDADRLKRAVAAHKKKRQESEREVKDWQKRYQEVEKENEKLRKEIEEIKRQRDTYKQMLFKKNVQKVEVAGETALLTNISVKKRGGQRGHKGYGRSLPLEIH